MNAERYAFEISKKTDSDLTIMHVYDTPFSFPLETEEYIKEAERLRKFELRKLKGHCEKLMQSLNIRQNEINWKYVVLEGNIGSEIKKEAEHNRPDFIITGKHNSEEVSFLGISHAWQIIKKSNFPILSIPPSALLTDIKKIVFAAEYREGEISGILSLVKIAKKFDAELVVLHISNHMLAKDFETQLYDKFKADVQAKVPYEKLKLRLVYAEDIAEGLNNFCLSTKADWLVVSHSRSFQFGKSFTKEMSLHSQIPLLVVPDFYMYSSKEPTEAITETLIFKQKDYTPG